MSPSTTQKPMKNVSRRVPNGSHEIISRQSPNLCRAFFILEPTLLRGSVGGRLQGREQLTLHSLGRGLVT